MDITRERCADGLNVIVKGRIDGYWADHLAKELAEVLREGVHQVRLDMADVKYMSSAGIGTLVEFYKQFKAIQGSFAVINASAQVRRLLNLTKIDALLIFDSIQSMPAAAAASRLVESAGVK